MSWIRRLLISRKNSAHPPKHPVYYSASATNGNGSSSNGTPTAFYPPTKKRNGRSTVVVVSKVYSLCAELIDCLMIQVIRTTFLNLYLWTARVLACIAYVTKKQYRTARKYQVITYHVVPLSPLTRQRLSLVRRKILVLDLDETLIHSHHDGIIRPMVKPGTPPDFVLRVNIDRHPVRFFVHCRPHVDYFLSMVSQWYDLVVFTASMEIYGTSVADKLDRGRGMLGRRYFRQHCTMDYGGYTKDLSAIHPDLSSIFILDNSPGAYRKFPENAIPIKSWFSDPSDTCLLNLLPFLDALRFTSDVRSVLSRNQLLQQVAW